MAWRENNRRVSNGEHYLMATDAALQLPTSRQWRGIGSAKTDAKVVLGRIHYICAIISQFIIDLVQPLHYSYVVEAASWQVLMLA